MSAINKIIYSFNKIFSLRIRNIHMSSHNLGKVLEDLQKNPYYEKYEARIAALQKTSPEYLQKLENQLVNKEKEESIKIAPVDTRQYSSVLNPKEKLKGHVAVEDKKLSDIFKVDLVLEKESAEIQTIWEEYHRQKEVLSATIPKDVYTVLQKNMKQYPVFLFPLPRSQGYEFIMCQSYGHSVHFTPLLAYQVHKENAPECLTVTHYTELIEKGIILLRGEYDKNVLTAQEAQCLANQFQMYYISKDENKQKLLEAFTKTPDTFKHMDLIAELENITL